MKRFVLLALALWAALIFLLLSAARAFGEPAPQTAHLESLTQAEAVETALRHHPKIHRAQARVRQAEARLAESRRWFRPQLSLYAGERLDSDSHRVGVQVSHDLDALWDRSKTRDAEQELAMAEQDLALMRQAVVQELVASCEGWTLARGEWERSSQRVRRAQRALEHGQEQHDEGLIASARLAELEQAVETAQHDQEEGFSRLVQAAVRYRQALGELGVL